MTVNSLGQQESDSSSRTVAERLMPLLPIGLAMFTLSALLYYHLRHDALEPQSALQVLVSWVYRSFGFAPSFLGFLLLLTWGSIWFVTGSCERALARLGRLFAMVVMLGVFLNLGDGGVSPAFHKGELGAWLGGHLVSVLGYYPSLVAVWAVTVAALLLATDFFFRDAFERLREPSRSDSARREAGVETEVTDHLKGLAAQSQSQVAEPAVALPSRDAAVVRTAPATRLANVAPVADVIVPAQDEVEVQPDAEDVQAQLAAERPSGRRSYYERRASAPPIDEEDGGWVPMAPESQDIDNAEIEAVERDESSTEPEPTRGVPRSLAADWFAPQGGSQPAEAPQQTGLPALPEEAAAEVVEAVGDEQDADDFAVEVDEPEVILRSPRAQAAVADGDDDEDEDVGVDEDEDVMVVDGLDADEPPDEDEQSTVHDQLERGSRSGPPWAADDAADTAEAEAEADADADVDPAHEDPVTASEQEQAVQLPSSEPVPPMETADEPLVSIPRPATAPQAPARQQRLFQQDLDPAVVEEAVQIVLETRRASAAMLQRKLRVDFDMARRLLAELANRGLVELDADAAQGRLLS